MRGSIGPEIAELGRAWQGAMVAPGATRLMLAQQDTADKKQAFDIARGLAADTRANEEAARQEKLFGYQEGKLKVEEAERNAKEAELNKELTIQRITGENPHEILFMHSPKKNGASNFDSILGILNGKLDSSDSEEGAAYSGRILDKDTGKPITERLLQAKSPQISASIAANTDPKKFIETKGYELQLKMQKGEIKKEDYAKLKGTLATAGSNENMLEAYRNKLTELTSMSRLLTKAEYKDAKEDTEKEIDKYEKAIKAENKEIRESEDKRLDRVAKEKISQAILGGKQTALDAKVDPLLLATFKGLVSSRGKLVASIASATEMGMDTTGLESQLAEIDTNMETLRKEASGAKTPANGNDGEDKIPAPAEFTATMISRGIKDRKTIEEEYRKLYVNKKSADKPQQQATQAKEVIANSMSPKKKEPWIKDETFVKTAALGKSFLEKGRKKVNINE